MTLAIFYNQATLSYNGGTVNSNITSGEIIEVLSATKTAVTDVYSDGSDITYVINIINSGNIPFNGISVTDNLGSYAFGDTSLTPLDYVENSVRYFANGVLQATPIVTSGTEVVFSNINVPANGVATIVYTTTANTFAPPIIGGIIENTAIISGGGITPITATEQITSEGQPLLSITKSVSPTTVAENGEITYTFVIENRGNTEALTTDNLVITDTFNPVLNNISVTYNGSNWSESVNYTYDEALGLFTTVNGQITVPAASYTQDATTGNWIVSPGTATLTVTGTV